MFFIQFILLVTSTIYHFMVVCSVTWPLNASEAGGDLVLIQTSLLLFCKSSYYSKANQVHHMTKAVRSVSKH